MFLGRVVALDGETSRAEDGTEHASRAEIEIEKRFWGVPKTMPDRIRIASMGSYPSWTPGEEYLVVADILPVGEDESEIVVSNCTPTRSLKVSRVGLRTVDEHFCDKPGGTIVGQVSANDGRGLTPLPNVQVRITDEKGKMRTAVTDDEGIYIVHHLPIGFYRLDAQVPPPYKAEAYNSEGAEVQEQGECVDGSRDFEAPPPPDNPGK